MGDLITLQQAKDHLRISAAAVDPQVQALVAGAESWLAETLGTAWKVTRFVHELTPRKQSLRPPVLPLVAVASVTDLWGPWDVPSSSWRLSRGPSGLFERIVYGQTAPAWWPEGSSRYEVTYTAGYNNGDMVKAAGSVAAPEGLRLVALDLVARAWANRGGKTKEVAAGIEMDWDSLGSGEITARLAPFRLGSAL